MISGNDLATRIADRCRQIGKEFADVLKRAGVSDAWIKNEPKHGRRYDRLEAVAGELDWGVADLVGETTGPLNRDFLRQALEFAIGILGGATDERLPDLTVIIYSFLSERQREGRPVNVDDPEVSALIYSLCQAFLAGGGRR